MNVFNYLPITFVIDMSNQNSFIDLEKFTAMFNIIEKFKDTKDTSHINSLIDQHPHFINPKYTCSTHYHLTDTMY